VTRFEPVPRLAAGARVGLVAPAGAVPDDAVDRALARCAELGLVPVLRDAVRARHGYLAGPDAARAAELRAALEDPGTDAVWALRGGYGAMRILDTLDLAPLAARPKAVVGFSDITALHLALARERRIAFHGPNAGAPWDGFAMAAFRRALFDGLPQEPLPLPPDLEPPTVLRPGRIEGPLLGGNLALLAHLCGTRWALDARGAVLVVEDVGEAAYRIDRALTQLRLAGALDGVAGLVFGQFTNRPVTPGERPLVDVLRDFADALGVPALAGVPVGHVEAQWTLPLGARMLLDAGAGALVPLESGLC
jgi:muramoyltetrapeptide carboxypeptidase